MYLHVADEEGAPLSGSVLRPDAELGMPPRFAKSSARIAMLAGRRVASPGPVQLLVYFLSPLGEVLGEPLALDSPPSVRPRDAVIAAGADGGFLIAAQNDLAAGMIRARIGSDGRVLEGVTELVGGPRAFSEGDLVARDAGFVLAANSYEPKGPGPEAPVVFALDASGRVTGSVTVFFKDEKWGAWASIAIREGRVFVLYTATLLVGGQEVRLVELGCPRR